MDPGTTVPVNVVFKALRCEIITFLEANRLRRAAFPGAVNALGYQAAIDQFSYIDLDEGKYGALQVDLKTIDTVGLTLGVDWKTAPIPSGKSQTWHLGPSLNGFKTYTRTTVFALPQDGKLGPSKRNMQSKSDLAGEDGAEDAGFFCYVEPPSERPLKRTVADIEALVAHQIPEVEKFERIYVDGTATLAQWLERTISREMAKSWLAKGDYMESVYAGQLQYSFALDIKPGIDLKYTLIANSISPLVPDLSASRENSGTFTLNLNTQHVVAAFGAKNGSALIASDVGPPPPYQVWGPPPEPKKSPPGGHFAPVPKQRQGASAPTRAPAAVPSRGPGVRLEYPLPLPSLVPPANQ
ncbi:MULTISPECIES: hypothetical protein [unclassified Bradyrhizobium]|uniref:hypothetical protein n=1 Tax=unclassified Bradyrhizobium TaxID=2631580 RepID=UPI0029164918|nr:MULTISPECIES: hypothetical protein [unclassified Bradyrhizobium]